MRRLWVVAVLGAITAGFAGFGVSGAAGSSSAGAPIPIGVLTSLTGNFTPWGIQVRDGAALAVSLINKSGGIASGKLKGRKLKLVVVDDQSTPNAGIDGFKLLTQQNHVVSIGGVISSSNGVVESQLAEQAHIPLFLVKSGANEILTPSTRYTFRSCLPAAAEVAGPILQYAQTHHITSVGAIVADYAWGQSIKSSLESTFAGSGIKLTVEVAPVPTKDFTTYLRALQGAQAQMIVATGHPPGGGAILVQAGQLGMKVPVAGAYSPFSLVAGAAGSAAYGKYEDFKCENINSPAWKKLAKKFLKSFPNDVFFEDDALAGYAYVNIVAKAIAAVGTNPAKIAAYIHANTFDIPGYTFPLKWTKWGEMSGARIAFDIITKGPAPAGLTNGGATWYPKQLSISKPLTPYQP
ncbi:MAG TPA: ABC transporter substrate-binding protein [Gaiellaceae bacterium]|nr:ABC transporter substrate-binding protein [Gaiellaceae bacterium]